MARPGRFLNYRNSVCKASGEYTVNKRTVSILLLRISSANLEIIKLQFGLKKKKTRHTSLCISLFFRIIVA